jgi:AbiV family abortive infection protein
MNEPGKAQLSAQLLKEYSLAALGNASELVAEALVLWKHSHFARAYFLAVASIEETGKAYLAFDGQGRNLSDSAVASKLRRAMEDHPQKISNAFTAWLIASPSIRQEVMPAINLMLDLRRGREPSMYTDLRGDLSRVQVPAAIVRKEAAFDCIRLATDCLAQTATHIAEKAPEPRTRTQDQLFAMKTEQFQKIAKTEDFWWYYISELEAGRMDWADAVISYRDNFAKRSVLFRNSPQEAE